MVTPTGRSRMASPAWPGYPAVPRLRKMANAKFWTRRFVWLSIFDLLIARRVVIAVSRRHAE